MGVLFFRMHRVDMNRVPAGRELDGDLAAVVPIAPFQIVGFLIRLIIDVHADKIDGKRHSKSNRQVFQKRRLPSPHTKKRPRRFPAAGVFFQDAQAISRTIP